jgi:DNA primase
MIQAKSLPSDAWREQARIFVHYCQEQLYCPAGRDGLNWLHGRGLTDATIKRWGLGWHDKDRWRDPEQFGLTGKKVWLPRGVVIPWTVGGDVRHVKVRRFADDPPKYIRVRGGQPALYGLDFVTGKRVVVICEGELDAVLLWQEAGDLVDVVSIGTKGQKVAPPFLARLVGAARWLVALDNDADDKAQEWGDFSPRVRRVHPLQGNDLTEFAQAGGDLRQWVRFHLDRDRLENGTRPQDVATAAPDLEAQATALLARCDNLPHWAREWADLAERAGWPCWGFATWADWAADTDRQAGVI